MKAKLLSKKTSKFRTVYDGDVSLPIMVIGKYYTLNLVSSLLFTNTNYISFSSLSSDLLDSIHDKMFARQSLTVDIEVCVSVGESYIYTCVPSAYKLCYGY